MSIGVIDPDAYYKGGCWTNLDHTIEDTSQYDKHELRAIYGQIGVKPLRVLIAGCAAVQSVCGMAHLLLPGSTLLVIDLNRQNLLRLEEQYRRYDTRRKTVSMQ